MTTEQRRVVKVRINASGRRVIGCIELAKGDRRVSDVLNGPGPCILLSPDDPAVACREEEGSHVIFKDAISYLEAVEEPRPGLRAASPGEFRPVIAELRNPEPQQIIAEVFVPEGQCLLDVFSDPRPFLNLRNVPADEADEVRDLLRANAIDFYETQPSPWGISSGGLW
ncbi:MAG: hypothetical protein HY900_09165, partial [Deltaproteobacteria bacterium]|nr:hypothetical protein [Deltaproteobacteria bacterium]